MICKIIIDQKTIDLGHIQNLDFTRSRYRNSKTSGFGIPIQFRTQQLHFSMHSSSEGKKRCTYQSGNIRFVLI